MLGDLDGVAETVNWVLAVDEGIVDDELVDKDDEEVVKEVLVEDAAKLTPLRCTA